MIGQTISHYRIVDNLGAGNKRTAADLAAAISYFNQAIDKDPAYAVAHLGLADAYTVLPSYGRSPSQDFPKSNAAAPQSPGARPHLGSPPCGARQQRVGKEALAEINRAHRLDPLSPVFSTYVGIVHVFARQYDDAIPACSKVSQDDPAFALSHYCLAQAYWGKRMYPQVIEEWKSCGKLADDRSESEFASALEQGFHAGGGKPL